MRLEVKFREFKPSLFCAEFHIPIKYRTCPRCKWYMKLLNFEILWGLRKLVHNVSCLVGFLVYKEEKPDWNLKYKIGSFWRLYWRSSLSLTFRYYCYTSHISVESIRFSSLHLFIPGSFPSNDFGKLSKVAILNP